MSTYKSLKDHVYSYIINKIQHGELLPGDKINEAEICEDLDISRTPAREALIQLSSEDILKYVPRKGFSVEEADTKKKLDTYEVIGVLDGLAARLAINNLSNEDILKMQELVERIDVAIKYKNYNDYMDLQMKFHDVYISKCGNETLVNLLSLLKNNIIRQSYLSSDEELLFNVLSEGNKDHKNIVKYFKEKNSDKLEEILKNKHWQTAHISMI